MALTIAVAATLAPRVTALIGGHRTVSFGLLLMVAGLIMIARLGVGIGYGSLMPGFVLFGIGAGLMNVPLTNAVLESSPTGQAGIASALLNDSREVAGLLGITVIGAVLSTRETSALRVGVPAHQAFIDGYHTGMWVAIGLLAAGVVLSYVSLRPRPAARGEVPEASEVVAVAQELEALEAEDVRPV